MQLAALLIAGAIAQQKLETRLVEVEPVTQASRSASIRPVKEFSMNGIVFRDGFQLVPVGTDINASWARLVYNIPPETHAFRCSVGISDSSSETAPIATFRILVDGELVKELTVDDSIKPTNLDIPLKGAKSLLIQITGAGAVGNPIFSHVASVTTPPKGPSTTPGETPRVNLKSPEANATFKNKVKFEWDAVAGAVGYGVEIIMLTNADPKVTPSRFMRVFSAKGTSFEWNFGDDVLTGEYQVSVLGFGKRGVITRFSLTRKFKIVRK